MLSLIDSNTVAIVGSAPQYAHGTVDPIDRLRDRRRPRHRTASTAASAASSSRSSRARAQPAVGLRLFAAGRDVDLVRPAQVRLRAEGLFGPHVSLPRGEPRATALCHPPAAPRGRASECMQHGAAAQLRHHMYTYVTQWTGGIYAAILGSRPGGVVAATWAAMMLHGRRWCRCRHLHLHLHLHPHHRLHHRLTLHLHLLHQATWRRRGASPTGARSRTASPRSTASSPSAAPTCSRLAIGRARRRRKEINVYAIADCMKRRELGPRDAQNPPAVHLALTPRPRATRASSSRTCAPRSPPSATTPPASTSRPPASTG